MGVQEKVLASRSSLEFKQLLVTTPAPLPTLCNNLGRAPFLRPCSIISVLPTPPSSPRNKGRWPQGQAPQQNATSPELGEVRAAVLSFRSSANGLTSLLQPSTFRGIMSRLLWKDIPREYLPQVLSLGGDLLESERLGGAAPITLSSGSGLEIWWPTKHIGFHCTCPLHFLSSTHSPTSSTGCS